MLREKKENKKKGIDYFHDETTRSRIKEEGNFNVRVLLAFLFPAKNAKQVFLSLSRDSIIHVRASMFAIIMDATSKCIYIYVSRKNGGETRPRWRFNVFREQHPGFLLLPINCASKRAKLRLTGPGLTEENRNNPWNCATIFHPSFVLSIVKAKILSVPEINFKSLDNENLDTFIRAIYKSTIENGSKSRVINFYFSFFYIKLRYLLRKYSFHCRYYFLNWQIK